MNSFLRNQNLLFCQRIFPIIYIYFGQFPTPIFRFSINPISRKMRYLRKIWYFCILSWSAIKFNRKNPIFTISFWDPRKIFIFISSNYVKIAHKSYVIWSNLVYLLKNLSAQLVTQISQYQKIFISLKLVNKNIIYLMQKQSRICRF